MAFNAGPAEAAVAAAEGFVAGAALSEWPALLRPRPPTPSGTVPWWPLRPNAGPGYAQAWPLCRFP